MAPVDIVLVHQNMPAQFRHLALALGADPAVRPVFISRRHGVKMPGVQTAIYDMAEPGSPSSVRHVRAVEGAVRFAEAAADAAFALKREGVDPRLVIAHPGWGEALFLRDIWPKAKILTYAEYYYQPHGGDIGFDPMFPATPHGLFNARMMNAQLLLSHEAADAMLSPTQWQASRHPAILHDRIRVIFEGVDTQRVCPDRTARFAVPEGPVLTAEDEVITYIARNLEPHRGFHVFLRALPALLQARPRAQVVIVGGDDVSYSPRAPAPHANWRERMLCEIDLRANAARVHFTGKLAYADYLALLRISRAHIYLTYPFVLSWSCVEAMAAGCAIVASDTAPVREVIDHGEQGLLVPFFDGAALVETVCRVLDDRPLAARLGEAARNRAVAHYDVRDCLRQQLLLVHELLGQGT